MSLVIVSAVADRLIEDRRIGSETGHREFIDVALQRSAVEQTAGDVVEPKALAEVVERFCRVHWAASNLDEVGVAVFNRRGSKPRRSPIRSMVISAGENVASAFASCA